MRPLIVAEPRGQYFSRPPVVADCSVLAAVLFNEPEAEDALASLSGKALFAPWLLDAEIVSVAVKKSLAGFSDLSIAALEDYGALRIARKSVNLSAQGKLAVSHQLTAYDAAYLQLAIELGAPLLTFDQKLGRAARSALESGPDEELQ